jgi:predicted nucleic acid-binding protein
VRTYVDSSVVLRIAFGEPRPLREWGKIDRFVASALLTVECFRAVDRLGFQRRFSDEEVARRYETVRQEVSNIDIVDLMPAVLDRAAQPFPIALGTLDALHLATALLWREREEPGLLFATHDRTLGLAARAVGFTILGL